MPFTVPKFCSRMMNCRRAGVNSIRRADRRVRRRVGVKCSGRRGGGPAKASPHAATPGPAIASCSRASRSGESAGGEPKRSAGRGARPREGARPARRAPRGHPRPAATARARSRRLGAPAAVAFGPGQHRDRSAAARARGRAGPPPRPSDTATWRSRVHLRSPGTRPSPGGLLASAMPSIAWSEKRVM